MNQIYLVEDEKALSDLLKSYLIEAGYSVTSFDNGLKAKAAISLLPDLWVLDIMLPGLDGYALLKEIKTKTPHVPVIFMSARSAELDRVLGLEMGSDDYLPKPFLPRELVLRVQRLLKPIQEAIKDYSVKIGSCTFDRNERLLKSVDSTYTLSVKEFDILEFLIMNQGSAKSRTEILDNVWGLDYFGSERVVDDTLRRIRKKVPQLPIETVYGFGYILKTE
jgi:two-component system response regulator CssR